MIPCSIDCCLIKQCDDDIVETMISMETMAESWVIHTSLCVIKLVSIIFTTKIHHQRNRHEWRIFWLRNSVLHEEVVGLGVRKPGTCTGTVILWILQHCTIVATFYYCNNVNCNIVTRVICVVSQQKQWREPRQIRVHGAQTQSREIKLHGAQTQPRESNYMALNTHSVEIKLHGAQTQPRESNYMALNTQPREIKLHGT